MLPLVHTDPLIHTDADAERLRSCVVGPGTPPPTE